MAKYFYVYVITGRRSSLFFPPAGIIKPTYSNRNVSVIKKKQCIPAAFMHPVVGRAVCLHLFCFHFLSFFPFLEYHVMRLPPAGFLLLWRWRARQELHDAHIAGEEI